MVALTSAVHPTREAWQWQQRGACRRVDPELFFHPDMERGAARQHREAAALLVCAECPVLGRCRRFALEQREAHGVWGGLTEEQRQQYWSSPTARRVSSR